MTYFDARSSYRRAQEDASRVPEDPHGIVAFTLAELSRALQVLAACAEEGRALPEGHLTRALTAIYVLQSSLDFEAGGELADNLFKVYEFARQQVLTGFSRAPATVGLTRSATLIEDIRTSWGQIAPGAGR